jgi:hypothetical protein
MKFLINSRYLHAKIAEAIGKESTEFITDDRMITFIGDGGQTEMEVEPLIKQTMSEKFYPAYWRDVVRFLKTIQEQPITVILEYNSIDIHCEVIFKLQSED